MISTNIQFLLISLTMLKFVTSVDIECDFKSDDFDVITNQYTCDVQNNLMINSKNVVIQTFRGSHKFGKTSNDVTGLSVNDKKIQFMPESLGEKFKNLVAVKIRQGRLKEISQNDLRSFSKLRYLNLDANDIEALDDDLFEFNVHLEIIWFEGNRIKNIGMSVFDNLKSLNDLDLNGNACISKRMSNSREMAEFLREVKNNCFDASAELVKFKQKYKEENSRIVTGSDVEMIRNVSSSKPNAQLLISNKDIEIEELRIVVRNLTELMTTKYKEAEQKLSKIQSKSKDNDIKFEKKLANLTSEKTKSNFQLSTCQNNLTQIFNSTTELTQKVNQLESQLIDLQVTYSQSLEKYENLSIENQKLTDSLNSTDLRLKDIDMESLPDQLDEKIKEYMMLDSQLKKRETDLKNFELEVAKTISALTKSKERIEKVLKHKNQEIIKKDNEIKKLRTANNQLQDQLKEFKSRTISLERIVKADIVSLKELNKTKELLEIEKEKFQDLEVKFNATLENRTIECLVQQELKSSNQLQQGMDNSNDTMGNLARECQEQLKTIQSTITMKNNRIKALLMDNKLLKNEKLTLLTRQGKLKETVNNKTFEWSQEVEKTKDLETIITHNEAVINELLVEKSQLKTEINILTDSEERLKNSLSNKYGNCYNNIEKLNQDLKNCSQIESKLKDNIVGFENKIKNDNSTITNLMNEVNYLRNQTHNNSIFGEASMVHQELQNCTKIVDELRQKNLELTNIISSEDYKDNSYDVD